MFLRKSKFESIINELENLKRENKSCKSENISLKKVNDKLEKLLKDYESKERECMSESCDCTDEELYYSESSLGTKKYEELYKVYMENNHDNKTLNLIGHDSSIYLDAIFDIIYMLDTRKNTKTSIRKLIVDKFLTNDTKKFVNSPEFITRMESTPEKDFGND